MRIESNIDATFKELGLRARFKVDNALNIVDKTMKAEILTGPRTGETYRVPYTSTYYVASRGGEATATVTGRLKRSYVKSMHSVLPLGRYGSDLDYAKFLEFGTRKMEARPNLRLAFARAMPRVRASFQTDWNRV